MIERDGDVVASSAMVQSLSMSIEKKIIIHNNLGFTFEKMMMFLFMVDIVVVVQVMMVGL
jgi:cell division protein FtsL